MDTLPNLSTALLDKMDPGDVAKLDPATLEALQTMCAEEIVTAKRRDNNLHKAFEQRYGAKASEALLRDGRDTGTVHLADGEFEVTVTRPKRVKWDDAKVRTALDSMSSQDARHYAKVEIKIDERKFAAAPPAVQALFVNARTVETGKASYCLTAAQAQGEAA